MPSPLPTLLVCNQKQRGGVKCGETFKSEKDLKSHTHKWNIKTSTWAINIRSAFVQFVNPSSLLLSSSPFMILAI